MTPRKSPLSEPSLLTLPPHELPRRAPEVEFGRRLRPAGVAGGVLSAIHGWVDRATRRSLEPVRSPGGTASRSRQTWRSRSGSPEGEFPPAQGRPLQTANRAPLADRAGSAGLRRGRLREGPTRPPRPRRAAGTPCPRRSPRRMQRRYLLAEDARAWTRGPARRRARNSERARRRPRRTRRLGSEDPPRPQRRTMRGRPGNARARTRRTAQTDRRRRSRLAGTARL